MGSAWWSMLQSVIMLPHTYLDPIYFYNIALTANGPSGSLTSQQKSVDDATRLKVVVAKGGGPHLAPDMCCKAAHHRKHTGRYTHHHMLGMRGQGGCSTHLLLPVCLGNALVTLCHFGVNKMKGGSRSGSERARARDVSSLLWVAVAGRRRDGSDLPLLDVLPFGVFKANCNLSVRRNTQEFINTC